MYGNAEKVSWKERHRGFYEADFVLNGNVMSAIFNADGLLMQTKEVVPGNRIPAAVVEHAKKLYPEYTISEYGKITTPDKKVIYELEILHKGGRKSLIFDSNNAYKGEKYFNDDDPLVRPGTRN